jgi:hypothetical protein
MHIWNAFSIKLSDIIESQSYLRTNTTPLDMYYIRDHQTNMRLLRKMRNLGFMVTEREREQRRHWPLPWIVLKIVRI